MNTTQNILSRQKLLTFLNSLDGKFFGVRYIKANGEPRIMSCRLGVKKYLKGTGKYSANSDLTKPNITVWDTGTKEYRTLNTDRLHAVIHNGNYTIV